MTCLITVQMHFASAVMQKCCFLKYMYGLDLFSNVQIFGGNWMNSVNFFITSNQNLLVKICCTFIKKIQI
jgi:hypothetical protein